MTFDQEMDPQNEKKKHTSENEQMIFPNERIR